MGTISSVKRRRDDRDNDVADRAKGYSGKKPSTKRTTDSTSRGLVQQIWFAFQVLQGISKGGELGDTLKEADRWRVERDPPVWMEG